MLTDIPLPMKKENSEVVDVDKLYNIVVGLNVIENARLTSRYIMVLLDELEMCIKEEVDFKNEKIFAMYKTSSASDEAIEAFSALIEKGSNFVDMMSQQVELFSERLMDSITPEMLFEFMGFLKNMGIDSFLDIKNIRKEV